MKKNEKLHLAAPCGLYCGACTLYVAQRRSDSKRLIQLAQNITIRKDRSITLNDLDCKGCLSNRVSFFCRECNLRSCVYAKDLTHCAQCTEFPCQQIIDFNDDGRPHHGEVLTNIRRQKKIGLDTWISEQKERWRCSNCDSIVDWYTHKCPECDAPLVTHF